MEIACAIASTAQRYPDGVIFGVSSIVDQVFAELLGGIEGQQGDQQEINAAVLAGNGG